MATNCTDTDPFITSPQMSNFIFMIGVSLCLFGLVLMISAAVLLHKATVSKRRAAEMYLLNGKLTKQMEQERRPHNPGETDVKVQGRDDPGGTEGHEVNTAHAQLLTNEPEEQTTFEDDGAVTYTAVVRSPTYRQSPPPPCGVVVPYACNLVPNPEATRHYDQGYQLSPPSDVNWYQTDHACDKTPPPPPRTSPPLIPNQGEPMEFQHGQYMPNDPNVIEYPYNPGTEYQQRANSPCTQVLQPVVYVHSRTSSLSSAGHLQSPTNQMLPSFPVSREGTLKMTYM